MPGPSLIYKHIYNAFLEAFQWGVIHVLDVWEFLKAPPPSNVGKTSAINISKMENIHLEFSLSVYVIIRRKTKRAFQFRRSERGIQTVLARKYVLGHVSDVFSEFLRILKINVSLSSIWWVQSVENIYKLLRIGYQCERRLTYALAEVLREGVLTQV